MLQFSLLLTVLLFSTLPVYYIADDRPEPVVLVGSITNYSEIDSCHYKGCPTASGKRAYKGGIACPRALKLGSKVLISGKTYTCEDRTAKWVEEAFPNTFDIWTGYGEEAHQEAKDFGRQQLIVKVYGI